MCLVRRPLVLVLKSLANSFGRAYCFRHSRYAVVCWQCFGMVVTDTEDRSCPKMSSIKHFPNVKDASSTNASRCSNTRFEDINSVTCLFWLNVRTNNWICWVFFLLCVYAKGYIQTYSSPYLYRLCNIQYSIYLMVIRLVQMSYQLSDT